MLHRRRWLGWALGAAAAPALGATGHDITRWPASLAAPPLQAIDLQGNTWTLDRLRGHAVLLNFWASWCPPCRIEMPSLQQLAEIYGPEKLRVLAINFREGRRRIARYVQDTGMSLPVLLDPDGSIARQWEVHVFPTTILINADGQPLQRVRGEMDWSGREAAGLIEPLLRH